MQRRLHWGLWILMGMLSESCFGLTLTGHVVDTRAQPIQGAEVAVCERYYVGSAYQDANVISPVLKTDAQGRARIRALPGSHSIYVGGDRVNLWRTTKTLRSGRTVPVEALVDPTPKVAGRVVDAQNRPVAHVLVNVNDGDHVLTDVNGRFSAYCCGHERFKTNWIVARDREHNRAALQRVTDLSSPLTLKLKPAWTLVGQVTDPQGGPVSAARISFVSRKAYMDERVLTSPQGKFTLKAIPPKQTGFDYRLTINAAGYGPGKSRRIESQERGSETLDMGNFPLAPATESVSGCVVNAQGVPVPAAELFVNSADYLVPQYPNSTATDEQGRFRLRHLCKGAIKIMIWTYDEKPLRSSETTVTLRVPAEDVKIVLGKELNHDGATSLLGKP